MLAIGTWILLVIFAILICIYVVMTNFMRKRRQGEPPIVKGHMVWGSAQHFAENAVSFLQESTKEYGDVFTIRLVNQYLTIINDPHSYEAMSSEKNFDFDPIQKQVNWNVFSFVLKDARKMIKDTGRTVRGSYLQAGFDSFANNLAISYDNMAETAPNPSLKNEENCHPWHTDGLRTFAASTIFDAIFNTVFGRDDGHPFDSNMVFRNLEVFHKSFNYFWLGFPKGLFPSAMKALEQLVTMPDAEELLARSDVSDYITTAVRYMQKLGQSEADIKGHNLVYLHVNYNTFRLAFWALNNLLENPKAHENLMSELNAAIEDKMQGNSAVFTMKDIEELDVLNSVVNESFRMASGVFMVRYIQEDTNFQTSAGKTFLMRKGDRVAIYPPAIHKDAEIFEQPMEFKYDRFCNGKKFYKNGEVIKHPLMAFGSLCPGKRYALLQIKWYLMSVLTRFDMRLQEGEHAQYAYEYHGHEILPPTKDIKFDFREKNHVVPLELAN
ncbi:hypothetical protein CAPTEDRAFT_221271 [Capitella teleta]|uniref:Cytochrome P450 n=1 Tax=Capitella teleta TaxID=283909 RepID=R7V022_CAPTE|nr:hypothetical protein CAPTEDRAFT_221271 [Capitella teleta]|eukprot:ELU11904.1 hypothetical protein CAPTEDRAFT_221271 [Capitella teleta]